MKKPKPNTLNALDLKKKTCHRSNFLGPVFIKNFTSAAFLRE